MARILVMLCRVRRHPPRHRPHMSEKNKQILHALEGNTRANTMMKSRSLGKWHLELKSTTCEYGLYPSSSSNEVQTTSQIEMGNFKTKVV
ncbi:hypothetical protein HID58_066560 [Brassica napus]|uniref:Uncharacterized protein n=1 Tax=Brassica napus TaxID=3708 RepID=A0ABQ7ZG44_BRANA|nr:hypothetical protein HID58_066560 [Brassica napus]